MRCAGINSSLNPVRDRGLVLARRRGRTMALRLCASAVALGGLAPLPAHADENIWFDPVLGILKWGDRGNRNRHLGLGHRGI